jgi:hypothetical protein
MQYAPIVQAIETMLATNASTKDLIAAYRLFTLPEAGTWATPLCVIAPYLDVISDISGFSPTIVRNKKLMLTIHFLERSYVFESTHILSVTALDTLQHNACAVLESDCTLGGTVINSKIVGLKLQPYNAEYFEWIITLDINTKFE